MPPVVAASAIAAGGTIAGSLINRSAAGSATKAQQAANDAQLAYLREQADRQDRMAREQWDAEQARRAPFRAAAAQILSNVTGVPVEPYQPRFVGSGRSAGAEAGWTRTAADPTLDRGAIEAQIRNEFTSRGMAVNDDDVRYFADKASKPDIYSDGKVRVGWNPYLASRMINRSASADPSLAGDAGVIGYQSAGGGGTVGAATRHIDYTSQRPTGGTSLARTTGDPLVQGTPGLTIADMMSRRY